MPWPAPIRFIAQTSPMRSWRRLGQRCAARRQAIVPCNDHNWCCWCMSIPTGTRSGSAATWDCRADRSIIGENAGRRETFPWRTTQDAAVRPFFPPRDHALVKALACERVAETGEPISRQSLGDLTQRCKRCWAKPLAAARCRGSWTRTRSSPGNTNTGSFRETHNSWKKLGRSSTCMRGIGAENP